MCLINRLIYLGDGAQAAAGRRIVARQLEEGTDRPNMGHIRGWGLSFTGQLFVSNAFFLVATSFDNIDCATNCYSYSSHIFLCTIVMVFHMLCLNKS